MAITMKGMDFISIHDITEEQFWQILKTTEIMKLKQKAGEVFRPLEGKTLGMIFTKSSTRTRISFEVGMYQLGGYPLFLNANDLQLRRGETIADTARVLSRFLDGIMIRTFAHQDVLDLAKYGSIPVINGLTDLLHPCQVMADLYTAYEKRGHLAGLKLAFVGDGDDNVAHSLMFGCAKAGMHMVIGFPKGYEPNPELLKLAREDAAMTGGSIELTNDPRAAAENADIMYADVFASMGQEAEHDRRLNDLKDFQINEKLMSYTRKDSMFMHCLPAHRGEEVTDEVADGYHSVIFDEAENRLHAQKAILALVI
jgi:ornithine carbamoyltransferase